MRKIIAVDIDGTLLNSKNQISEKTKNALLKAQDMGHILVIASGRSPKGVKEFADILKLDKNNGLLSNFNGGKITNYQTKEVIISHTLDIDFAKEVLSFTDTLPIDYFIYKDGIIITNNKNTFELEKTCQRVKTTYQIIEDLTESLDFAPNKILFTGPPDKIDKWCEPLKEKFGEKTNQVKSLSNLYELMPKEVDKGSSLEEIADYYGMDIKNVIAFGDEENDRTMIEKAGVGVVMANGSSSMKKIADYITKSNDEDGIAYYLENFLFKNK